MKISGWPVLCLLEEGDGQGWKLECDLCAVLGRASLHAASELAHSFPHASDADARVFGLDLCQLFSQFVRRPLALALSANFETGHFWQQRLQRLLPELDEGRRKDRSD